MKILVLSDLHCGHNVGLTPVLWQKQPSKYYDEQKYLYDFYKNRIEQIGKVDVTIVNGDAIDGRGELTGGTEQISTDRKEQVEMAYECLKIIDCKKFYFTYGSPYHVGREEDWEALLADKFNAPIKSHLFLKVGNFTFDIKHKINSSIIPHGRYTAIARDKLWNSIWAEYDGQPKADILIRSHVHYFNYCGDERHLNIITPALQGVGTKYGARQCTGIVKCGFIEIDLEENDYSWRPHILNYNVELNNEIFDIGYKE
jgi:hypothetical protein